MRVVEMTIAAGDKVLERHVAPASDSGPLLETPPSDGERCVDRQEEEERAAHEDVERGLGGDVRCHEAALPAQRDVVEKSLGRGKRVGLPFKMGSRRQPCRCIRCRILSIPGGESRST